MKNSKKRQLIVEERVGRYVDLLQKQTGRAIRPYRADGYINLLNRYGTQRDTTEHYQFKAEPTVADDTLVEFYESNGLFSKIIDAPAEEAIKHGFELKDIKNDDIQTFYEEALEELNFEEVAITACKWTRLFGGAIIVMLINDGRGLDEPIDWHNIESVDDLRVYDRSLIQPDYNSMYEYDPHNPLDKRGSRLGMPERYTVFSRYGTFTVHDDRCLVFQNGILPENTTNSIYQLWGMPEYVRINKAIRDTEVAHGSAVKLLDRSVQPVYKMKDLSAELSTEEGEDRVLRRLSTIDMARGLMNTITIDNEGEDYDFRQFSFTGVSETIDTTCNLLSALTSIPQTILFGRSPAGMNATGISDLEVYYNYVERFQKRVLKSNIRHLLSIIFQAGINTGEIDEMPKIKIQFNSLWSQSEQEKLSIELQKAQLAQTRAATAGSYIQMEVLDPSEVRKKLAETEEFDVETMLDDYTEEELLENAPKPQEEQGGDMMGAMGDDMGTMMDNPQSPMSETSQTQENNEKDDENGKKYLTSDNKTDIMTMKGEENLDGAPIGNQNAAGPHNMGASQNKTGGMLPPCKNSDVQEAIKNGSIKTNIDSKKQSKHYKNSDAYKKAVKQGKNVSTLTIDEEKAQKLIKMYKAKGDCYGKDGAFKSTFTYTSVIGDYVSKSGQVMPTKRGTIHYSKSGCHIVPAKP